MYNCIAASQGQKVPLNNSHLLQLIDNYLNSLQLSLETKYDSERI